MNPYVYAGNNPVMNTDPSGLDWNSGFQSEITQRFYNSLMTGNFWTDNQINQWGYGLIGAQYAGIEKEYIRDNPVGGALKFVSTMGVPSGIRGGAEIGFNAALKSLDKQGGHIVERHIEKSVDYLKTRLQSSKMPVASSFSNATVTARVVGDTLYANRSAIQTWVQSVPTKNLTLQYRGAENIGYGVIRGSDTIIQMNTAIIVLKPATNPMGYKVITAYPKILD